MIKKLIFTAAFFLALGATSAFADTFGSGTNTMSFTPSNNVTMSYSASGGLGYLIGAVHSSGTRSYVSSSGDAKIFYKDCANTGTMESTSGIAVPTGTASATFGSTWNPL